MEKENINIVVLEDEKVIREWIVLLLSEHLDNVNFIELESSQEAQKLIKSNINIDLVLSDNHFGDGLGIDLISQWKKFNCPIVMITSASIKRKALKKGANLFIEKIHLEQSIQDIIKLLHSD